jgi:hypothetical protein
MELGGLISQFIPVIGSGEICGCVVTDCIEVLTPLSNYIF